MFLAYDLKESSNGVRYEKTVNGVKTQYYLNGSQILAEVTGRTHLQADINRGYWYLGVSSLFGPLGYFFLFGEY